MGKTKWSKQLEDRLLGALAATGRIGRSCKVAEISLECYLQHLKNDPALEKAVQAAQDQYNDLIVDEIDRRGRRGVPKPQWNRGERCDLDEDGNPTQFEYSDRLLEMLAKSRMPEFREKAGLDVGVQQGGVLVVNAGPDDVEEWREKFNSMKRRQIAEEEGK